LLDEVTQEDQRTVAHLMEVMEIETFVAVGAPRRHGTVKTDGLTGPAKQFGIVSNGVGGGSQLIEMQVVVGVGG
jgi:hypothetical protein